VSRQRVDRLAYLGAFVERRRGRTVDGVHGIEPASRVPFDERERGAR
jgi:hypothetical protein